MNSHDTCDVLAQITAPTLVITGDGDRVIPPQNSTVLVDKIPNATLETISNAGHGFCFSHSEFTTTAMLNFLKS
jgi:3-oxoadipate enol-lactonase